MGSIQFTGVDQHRRNTFQFQSSRANFLRAQFDTPTAVSLLKPFIDLGDLNSALLPVMAIALTRTIDRLAREKFSLCENYVALSFKKFLG
jgi:hypothetical protein